MRSSLLLLMACVLVAAPAGVPMAAAGVINDTTEQYLGQCAPVDVSYTVDPSSSNPVRVTPHVRPECLP